MADQNDQDMRATATTAAGKSAVQDLTRSINLFAINTLLDAGAAAASGGDLSGIIDCVRGMSPRLATLARDLAVEATLIEAPAGATPPFPPGPRAI